MPHSYGNHVPYLAE